MRYTDFKLIENNISETKITKAYWNPSHGSYAKYVPPLIDKIKEGSPIYAVVNGDLVSVTIEKNDIKSTLELINAQMKASQVDEIIPDKLVGIDEDGNEVSFKVTDIDKNSVVASVNAGNVTEGVLGFAMAARFTNTSAEISADDIINIGRNFFDSGKNEIKLPVSDRTNDRLSIKVTLPSGDIKALRMLIEKNGNGKAVKKELGLSTEAGKKLDGMIAKAVNYANTGIEPANAVSKIQQYYNDNITQEISVVSDGAEAENQNMTKVDLKLIVKGNEDKPETLALLSLKAGSGRSQIGQASGRTFEKLGLFWRQSFNYELPANYKNIFDKEVEKYTKNGKFVISKQNLQGIMNGPIKDTYKWAQQKINKHLAGDSAEGEIDFLSHLQQGLLYHSGKNVDKEDASSKTRGDELVVVTILDPGAGKDFVELRFGKTFYQVCEYFDLECSPILSAKGGNGVALQVKVKPSEKLKDAPDEIKNIAQKLGKNNVLVQYRSYIQQGKTIRNIVEVDAAGKVLADLNNEMLAIYKKKDTDTPDTYDDADSDGMPDTLDKKPNDPNAAL